MTDACACVCHSNGAFPPPCDVPGGCGTVHASAPPPRCGLRCLRVTAAGVCARCVEVSDTERAELPELYVELRIRLPRGEGSGEPVSGSKSPPPPLSVDVLDLMSLMVVQSASWVSRVASERSLVGAILPTQRRAGRPDRNLSASRVASAIAWLGPHHEWATAQPWAVNYASEIRLLAHNARRLCRLYDEKPEFKAGVPCRRCMKFTLFRYPGKEDVECARATCQTVLRPPEYAKWSKLYAANPRRAVNDAERAAWLRATAEALGEAPSLYSHVSRLRARADELDPTVSA